MSCFFNNWYMKLSLDDNVEHLNMNIIMTTLYTKQAGNYFSRKYGGEAAVSDMIVQVNRDTKICYHTSDPSQVGVCISGSHEIATTSVRYTTDTC